MAGSRQLIDRNRSQIASQVVNMGFDFIFMGKVYNTFSVNTNGVLRLGDEQVLAQANTYGITGNERIVPLAGISVEYRSWWWWSTADADLKTNSDGKIHYKLIGNTPNRIMVVEWKNVGLNTGSGTSSGTFQVRLHESSLSSNQSGTIEFVYDQFVLSNDYRNFYLRTGFGIGPEQGNYIAINHSGRSLIDEQNYVSGPGSGNIEYFRSNTASDKMLYRFEPIRKPVGEFSNFEVVCHAPNAITIRFDEDCQDEAGIAVYRKMINQNDSKFEFIQSLSPDARTITDGSTTIGQQYVYRFYLLGEGQYTAYYTEYVTEPVQGGVAFQAIRSGNWSNSVIWDGRLPGNTDDIELGCASSVFVSTNQDAYVKNLTIQKGSFLTIEDRVTLYVSGEFVNHGVFNPIGSGRLVLNGSMGQTITNHGRGMAHDTKFTTGGGAPSWNTNQTGLVAEKIIQVNDTDFSAIKSITVDIRHSYLRDLSIYLIAPSGEIFTLSRSRGQQGQNYSNVIFTETGRPLPPTIQNVNLSGEYRPEESLATYTGSYAGFWILQVRDDFTGTGGSLNKFELILSKGSSNDLILKNVVIDNQSVEGVTLNSGLMIQGSIQFSNGIVHTSEAASILLDAEANYNEGNASSFVDGPMYKRGATNFTFPIGDAEKWAPVTLDNIEGGNNNTLFKVEYHKQQPNSIDKLDEAIGSISQKEYWDITPVEGNPTVDIVLHWKDADFSGITYSDASDFVVAHYTNDTWMNEGGIINITSTTGQIKAENISAFSPFTFGSESGTTLPVELTIFTGSSKPEGILLYWKTTSELNNSHFEVQRSINSTDWQYIGKVEGKGTVHALQQYSFLDAQLLKGGYYYRLKQIDYDGAFEYSHVVRVERYSLEDNFTVYPNPDQVIIKTSVYLAKFTVISQNGTEMLEENIEEFQSAIQLPMLADGIYVLKLSHQIGTQYQRLVVLKR